ncbi:MAG TPA: sigma 54-interacting transcriptional regulator [Candidatus Fimicola cottocaccae]|nr:sigma 54-interacting transcriptional regulator [Candidatus Fimicola cottocaccae]
MDFDEFKMIIDNLHDEIMVYDDNYKLVYLNNASKRHYGIEPKEMIGKDFNSLNETYWGNSTLPEVYKTKKTVAKRQITNMGKDIITIAVPIFDEKGNVKYVAQNVNDIYYINEINQAEQSSVEVLNKVEKSSENFFGENEKMKDVYSMVCKIKDIDAPCLILGETGTGKSHIAKIMHNVSQRKNKPFVVINCACMSPNLIESELFGYKKGAFTGANSSGKKGLVEIADGGTLFLDEISEMPYDLQAKLLLFIQEKEFIPIGGEEKKRVDVKIITATNRSLKNMVENGRFREDLYFRLNTFEIDIPPLRERLDEIEPLAEYYLKKFNDRYNKKHTIQNDVYGVFKNYSWPGNIREFSHIIEKAVVLSSGDTITVKDIPKSLFNINVELNENTNYVEKPLDLIIEEVERKAVMEAYKKHKTSVNVAKALCISQPKAYRLLQKYVYNKTT